MKISASYWIFEGGLEGTLPISDAMEQASQLGFDAIELGIASQGVLTHQTTQSECETVKEQALQHQLEFPESPAEKVGDVHQPPVMQKCVKLY